ncbi:TetR/AcrR family transcriptional regulator [Rhodococcus sp. ABRD24]|uniref:TetR/AcrR family transcriptional regulator n=1 Tax=Rhodococcus sp. ABRD24 TaxID=2507582 RepID=UPI00103FE697|nr:TetR/AcrR family transcriptional regulator [Rhodococcus sp. ABRD24]QBJ97303.1 TetR/AcrR family transcriptional regulator [Rhodococcus sp. ABRD24]
MSGNYESTRRRLTAKQAETVSRLTKCAVEVLREGGFAGLTVRLVAARAGVAPATAYTYFSSKEHLVAEVFWRRLAEMPREDATSDDRTARAVAVLRSVALLVSDEPELAAAVTTALLGRDPDVEHLRARVGLEIRERLIAALEPEPDQDLVEALELLYSGALVRAGMGYGSYTRIADRLEISARMILP